MDEVKQGAAQEAEQTRARELTEVLRKYIAGKRMTDSRIRAAENWWKQRTMLTEEQVTVQKSEYKSTSGWLHNVIVSKHADGNAAYPEPIIRGREIGDRAEAKKLQSILPVVLERNRFRRTYSSGLWDKLTYGTAIYKAVWDAQAENGLGEIAIENVNPLNVFWQPGISDIQKSRYFFQVELVEEELLRKAYPQLEHENLGTGVSLVKFLYDDPVSTAGMATVIDCYTKRRTEDGRQVLDYCKLAGDRILYDSRTDERYADRGWYDHGLYPYVFDALYPIKGSPCGYGYVEVCKSPQTTIDLLNTAYIRNAMTSASPRYFVRQDGGVNEEEFCDLSRDIVHVAGTMSEESVRPIDARNLSGNNVAYLDRVIQELRETSGNTETSTGSSTGGATAASAIAALQEASGKGSRDSTEGSYEAFRELIEIVIELIRQFYDLPRQFRILGAHGAEEYISYSNAGIVPQAQIGQNGEDMGLRKPVFDVSVTAQKKDAYTRVSQNELALQFYQLGFFNPQNVDATVATLDMMDFDGKDAMIQKVQQNGTIFAKLIQYMQMALIYAQRVDPVSARKIEQDVFAMAGQQTQQRAAQVPVKLEAENDESTITQKAREQSAAASQPTGGEVVMTDD